MEQQDYIISYDRIKYLIHQSEIDTQKETDNTGNKVVRTISYYQGDTRTLDYRFANQEDHINVDLNKKFNLPINDIYINSANINKISFTANEPSKAALHINNNHYHIDEIRNKLISDEKQFITDLRNNLPKLVTKDNYPIFEVVYFENMPFKFSKIIQEICKTAKIKSYGMNTDETAIKGFSVHHMAKEKVKRLNIAQIGLKNKQEDLTKK